MGLVASYLSYQDIAISQQTGKPRLVSEENSGLANVIPIDAVIEITSAVVERYDRSPGKFVSWEAIKAAVEATIRPPEPSAGD